MPDLYLNIGSNLGDRHALIERAVAQIVSAFPGCPVRRSRMVESEPWGYESPNPFLNIGLAVVGVEAEPLRLLRIAQRIEREISEMPHRNGDGTYRDRAIDIDLIAYGTLELETPDLILPHPRAHMRDFVMAPLRETAPESVLQFLAKKSCGKFGGYGKRP